MRFLQASGVGVAAYILGFYLAALLGVAGLAKLVRPQSASNQIENLLRLRRGQGRSLIVVLACLEVLLGGTLSAGMAPKVTSLATMLLFGSFLLVAIVEARRDEASCGCFGIYSSSEGDARIVTVSIMFAVSVVFSVLVWAVAPPIGLLGRVGAGGYILMCIGVLLQAARRGTLYLANPEVR